MAGGTRIEIEADVRWQSGEWRIQRVLWAFGALILLAAAAGLFGSEGPIAEARKSRQTFTVEYERFDRRDAPSELVITLESPPGEINVELGKRFAERADVERIVPEPDGSALTERGISMTFTSDDEAIEEIIVEYKPDRAGILEFDITVNGRETQARSFVYP